MYDNDIIEGIFSLIGFSIFFLFATIGVIFSSTNPDSYLYIDYNPPEDFWAIIGLLTLNFLFLCYFLTQSLKFRKSNNLNYRRAELILISDKRKYFGLCYTAIQALLVYFYIKYIETGLAFYNSLYIINGNNEEG